MRQTVPKEFDFIREARLQSALRARLGAAGFADRIVVPRPLLAACSRTLLVMEKLAGLPLSAGLRDGAGGEPARAAAREGVATLIRAYGPMIFGGGLFHADPHSGQVLLMRGGRIGLLDYGQVRERERGFERGRSFSFSSLLKKTEIEYLKNSSSQVKALSASRRRGLARIIIAVDDGDPDAIAAEMTAMGLMPGFENEDGGEDGNGDGTRGGENHRRDTRKKKKEECSGSGGEGGPPQAPVDPLLAAMLATVVFDTTPLPAAAVNPLDDSGKSLLKLAPVKAFPSVRPLSLSLNFLFFFFRGPKTPMLKTSHTHTLSPPLSLSFPLFFSLQTGHVPGRAPDHDPARALCRPGHGRQRGQGVEEGRARVPEGERRGGRGGGARGEEAGQRGRRPRRRGRGALSGSWWWLRGVEASAIGRGRERERERERPRDGGLL